MADITRRDFVHGLAGAPLAAGLAAGADGAAAAQYYPPLLTGLRGSHEGSYEVAHALGREGQTDFGAAREAEEYDLVVVGGGVSGLAAAYFYRSAKPDARILILDNHDDFGGHAKRNEFMVDGRHIIGYGGSQTMESPSAYSDVCKALLAALTVDLEAFDTAYDQDFFVRHGLRGGVFFDQETYGRAAFVDNVLMNTGNFMRLAPAQLDGPAALEAMPLSRASREAMAELMKRGDDVIPDVGLLDVADYLSTRSYLDFVRDDLNVTDNEVLNILQNLPSGYFGLGIDGITAIEAIFMGLPGIERLGLWGAGWLREQAADSLLEPYIHHFPDGNASIARLLVRSLIPEVCTGVDSVDVLVDRFDYSRLDRDEANARVRLNSTAVNVSRSAHGASVRYVRGGSLEEARARHCVLACYNMMIPYLCPDMPLAQKEALAQGVKVPLVYTNVALRNWRALKNLGIGQCFAPNMFHNMMMMDFPVSLGGYRFTESADEPVVLHMSSAFGQAGLHARDQFRVGRARLLGTSYDTIEADIRNQLTQLLGPGGFDAERDIAAITVNRWPHGYAYGGYTLFDPEYPPGQAPHEIGRQTWGPVAIANSDAGARAYLDEAIDQAHRAVGELLG